MGFIKDIKGRMAHRLLNKKLKHDPRKKEFHNMESAKTVGILFDTLNEKNHQVVKSFLNKLKDQGKKVEALGWVNADELPDYSVGHQILYYCNKDLNWASQPKTPEISEFINKEFDLLFDLSDSNHRNVQFPAALSKARCKVGRYSEEISHLDVMIDSGKEASLERIIEQSILYLTQIKKTN